MIKKIVVIVVRLFAFFVDYGFINRLKKIRVFLYSYWISYSFKGIHQSVKIVPPVLIKGGDHITIGGNTKIGRNGVLTAWDRYNGKEYDPKIVIGSNCNFGEYIHLTAINSISIGDGVLTGRWVTITDNSHGSVCRDELELPPIKRCLSSKGSVVIGDNVWIGDKVTILPNVRIGKGAIIAANSVVTTDVAPFTVVGGIPAKELRQL